MRIGLVCPYTWDVPGGVQEHVRGLADALIDLGHHVSVIAPADVAETAGQVRSTLTAQGRHNGGVRIRS